MAKCSASENPLIDLKETANDIISADLKCPISNAGSQVFSVSVEMHKHKMCFCCVFDKPIILGMLQTNKHNKENNHQNVFI